mgnify:FL=1
MIVLQSVQAGEICFLTKKNYLCQHHFDKEKGI